MLSTLKKLAAKIFPRKLAKEVTAETPTTVLETVPVTELPAEESTQFVNEPAPELAQAANDLAAAVEYVEETIIKPVQPVKKKKAPTKKKKKA
jgi:hypothetical protein